MTARCLPRTRLLVLSLDGYFQALRQTDRLGPLAMAEVEIDDPPAGSRERPRSHFLRQASEGDQAPGWLAARAVYQTHRHTQAAQQYRPRRAVPFPAVAGTLPLRR